jgi:hypothetical protein
MYINLIEIEIDLNNDELLETIWNHKKKKLIVISNAQQHGAQIW